MTTENNDNRINDSAYYDNEFRAAAKMIDEHTMAKSSPLTRKEYEARKAQLLSGRQLLAKPKD